MKNHIALIWNIIIWVIILVYPALLPGQVTDDAIRIMDSPVGTGARAIGLGGAYTGVADDYSAIFWNPGGLAQLRKMEFWMEFSHLNFQNKSALNESVTESSLNATKFNSFGMVFPVPVYRGSLVFGLGYQKVKDFDYINTYSGLSDTGSDWFSFDGVDTLNPDIFYDFFGENVLREGLVTDDGSLDQWSLAGAVDISPNISVGTALNFWKGESKYMTDFDQRDIYNFFNVYPPNFDQYLENRYINTEYSSFGLKFGSLIRLGRIIRMGITVETPQTFTVKENWGYSSTLYFDNGDFIDYQDDGTFEYEVKVPFRFQAGTSLALGPILATGNLEYTDWTQFEFQTSDFDLQQQNKYFNTDYRGTLKLRLGSEIGIPFLASQFRGGFIYDPTPLKGKDTTYDRKYITLGYGVLFDRVVKFDLAWMAGFWKQTTFDNLNPSGTNEDILSQKLMLTFSYRY